MSLHKLLELVLVLVIAVLLVVLVQIRPGAEPISRRKLVGLLIVGVIVGVVFLTTNNYYVTSSGL